MSDAELCWRCPTPMEWRHGTWQCPRCRFKLGCCEGDPQTPSGLAPCPLDAAPAPETTAAVT